MGHPDAFRPGCQRVMGLKFTIRPPKGRRSRSVAPIRSSEEPERGAYRGREWERKMELFFDFDVETSREADYSKIDARVIRPVE